MSKIMTWCTGLALIGAGCGQSAAVRAAGSWGRAIEVPGLEALNKQNAEVASVSCAAAGNCVAGGSCVNRHNKVQAFVADERHGRWGRAIEVPGLGALNVGGFAGVNTVSCSSAGNCALAVLMPMTWLSATPGALSSPRSAAAGGARRSPCQPMARLTPSPACRLRELLLRRR